jgi:hypothetical protein
MKKVSKAELRKAIIAAETERAKHPVSLPVDRARHPRLERNRRRSEEMASALLTRAGFDMDKFQALQEQRNAELERVVTKHKTEALRRASRQKGPLHASIAEQSEALRDLVVQGDVFPYPAFTLDTPFLIWSTPLLPLESAAVPFGSWAKFRVTTSEPRAWPKVSFYFYWASPFSDYAVINAATFMSATGHLRSHAPWTIGVNTSWVEVFALFSLSFGVSRTLSFQESEFLGRTGAFGSTFTGGDVSATAISAGVNLSHTMFAVPPGKVVVFEVGLDVNYENNDGNIDADFASGDFAIACPVVVFSLLNAPPK